MFTRIWSAVPLAWFLYKPSNPDSLPLWPDVCRIRYTLCWQPILWLLLLCARANMRLSMLSTENPIRPSFHYLSRSQTAVNFCGDSFSYFLSRPGYTQFTIKMITVLYSSGLVLLPFLSGNKNVAVPCYKVFGVRGKVIVVFHLASGSSVPSGIESRVHPISERSHSH